MNVLPGIIAIACLTALAGCANDEMLKTGSLRADEAHRVPPSDHRPSDEGVAEGQRYYANAHYGLAERSFRKAVEGNPKSVDAWLGLAASYDRLSRFDLADRAYRRVGALGGSSAAYHNNLGYHHLLRGNRALARKHLMRAAEIAPGRLHIEGNIRLLDTWKDGDEKALVAQNKLLEGGRLQRDEKKEKVVRSH